MNRQDLSGVRTAQDLERKYNFKEMASNNEAVKRNTDKIESLNQDLQDFADQVTTDIDDLQNQVDGNITSWFESGVPSLSTYPANEWATDEEKNNHLGDLYYDKNTGYSYRFTLSNGIYSWVKLTDSDITEALAVANAAQDTADKKRRVFMEQPTPPYDNGDMWVKDEEIWICQISRQEGTYQDGDFINNLKYTDDTKANAVGDDLEITKGTVTTISDNVDELSRTMTTTVEAVSNNGTAIGTLQENQSSLTQTVNNFTSEITTKVNNQDTKISRIEQDVGEIRQEIGDIADITTMGETIYASLDLIKINESEPIAIKVHPTSENISYIYPRNNLYPSSDLYPKTRTLRFHNTTTDEIIDYELPTDLLFLGDVYDEFKLDYETRTCQVTKRFEYNGNGEIVPLVPEQILTFDYPTISLTNGDYTVSLLGYSSGYIMMRAMAENIYTTQFATKVELHSEINQTADEINLEVSKKVGKDEVVSTINQSAEQITLSSNRLVVDSTNFKLDQQGNVDMSGKLSLNNGKMVFDGTRGLLTNLQYKSNSQFELLGVIPDSMIEISPSHPNYVNENTELVINANIPDDFEIISAKIQLIASPIDWYISDTPFWGYVRNISAFNTTNVDDLYWSGDGFSDFSVYQNNAILSEMNGSFGSNGYTQPQPSESSHPTSSVYSSDISSTLHNGWNRIVLKNRNNAPYYNGSDKGTSEGWEKNSKLCYGYTANCMAVLNIIGYTKF